MKRFHIHVGVKNLDASIAFYSALFGEQPAKQKADYAKWMLEDPRLNFAISTRTGVDGVDHLGLQVDEPQELEALTERLKLSQLAVYGEGKTTCCYAESQKAWVKDPSGIAWEAYQTMADAQTYQGEQKSGCCTPSHHPVDTQQPKASCGTPSEGGKSCC